MVDTELFIRIIIFIGLIALLFAGRAAIRAWQARRIGRLQVNTPLADHVPAGRPAVVSFSTPTCAECRTRQAPALSRLRTAFGGDVTIHTLSAIEHPTLVDQLGILTVPATVVLDARGIVRHVNLGYADENRLAQQLFDTTSGSPIPQTVSALSR
jgi:thiol-disulfide isomerase/thioredoxin